MDDDTQPTKHDIPGAPELGKGVRRPPTAPLISEKQTGPVFRAEPTTPTPMPTRQVAPIASDPAPFNDDEDKAPEASSTLDEHQARIEYLRTLRQGNAKNKSGRKLGRKLAIVALVILLLGGAAGAGGYYYLNRDTDSSKKAQPTAQTTTDKPSNEATTDDNPAATVGTKDFASSTFSLSLSYPEDWTPEELADKITITSPVVNLTDGAGKPVTGRIILRVRPQQAKPAEFTGGDVVAVMDSAKVSYTKPSASQRASTYISYLQYPATSVKGGLDGIYITGNYGYKYAQVVQLAEISKINPLIDVMFVSCPDTTCAATTQKQLTLSSAAWKSDTTNRPAVETMLKSLVL
ncbi:hypothetical protein BH09PAT4_BH09PAT4_02720 [soil metagenome]